MAKLVLTDAKVTINSVNLSTNITQITLSTTDDVVETTGFGSTGNAKTRVAGMRDNSVTIEFLQDYAASLVEATINGSTSLVGTTTTVVVVPTSSAVSATNPSYSFTALISEWQPLSGTLGEISTVSCTWPISGAITKATS